MINKEELTYPEHEHPHGVDNAPPNEYRIWVCEECLHIFTNKEIIADQAEIWGHPCKSHPCRKGQRCESHIEPYIPELSSLLSKEEEAIRAEYRDILRNAVDLIKIWHNGTAEEKLGKEQAVFMWNVYYNNAPEMKVIREALQEPNNQQ